MAERGIAWVFLARMAGMKALHRHEVQTFNPDPTLIESHADLLVLAPNEMTRNPRPIILEDKIKTLRDIVVLSNVERRPRNRHIAHQAIDSGAGKGDRSRHQYRLARTCTLFHKTTASRIT